jgi:PIN domain nuclease of toxin-antitoxin system
MALLLDTHIFYWVVMGSSRLSAPHKATLASYTDPIFVSAVTGWEIATKVRLGKWSEAAPLLPGLDRVVTDAGLVPLSLSVAQAELAGSFQMDHKDPFDRLLAAQALDLELTMVTVDPAFLTFGCRVLDGN